MRQCKCVNRGFTLIELLVSVGIIAILASLSASSVSTAKEKAKRIACLSNLRQMVTGASMYSGDNRLGAMAGTYTDDSDDMNWLFPAYVPSTRVFVCPSTRNFVRPDAFDSPETGTRRLIDLENNADGRTGAGSSYEVFGFMGIESGQTTEFRFGDELVSVDGVLKTTSCLETYSHKREAFGLHGAHAGAENTWLFLDADDVNNPNFPTTAGNHGPAGVNVAYCDGHAQWVPASKFVYSYELSQDEGRIH